MLRQGKSLWDALFTRTQRQVLSLLFAYPERSYYLNEIVRRAGVGAGSVQRELARLSDCGLLTVRRLGNQKHFQANRDCPIFPELRGIVIKTYGALDQLRTALGRLGGDIRLALIPEESTEAKGAGQAVIRMLIVADGLDYADAVAGLTEAENRIGRSVDLVLLGTEEFAKLRKDGNATVLGLLRAPRTVLVGRLEPDERATGPGPSARG